MAGEQLEFLLMGECPSKKNSYRPRKGGGFFKDDVLLAKLGALAVQIPSYALDLKLEHPDIVVQFTTSHRRSDRDNKFTTLLDLLVSSKVLVNDNIAHCNGRLVIEPAIVAPDEEESVLVTLQPRTVLDETLDRRKRASI